MNYLKYAEELLGYLVNKERHGNVIQNNVFNIAKGEDALIQFLCHEQNGVTANEISKRFNINTSRVAAILNSLSKKGYIERVVDKDDKRKIHVYITDKGKIYGYQKRENVLNMLAKMLEKLGEDDVKEYIRIQKKMIDIIHEENLHL